MASQSCQKSQKIWKFRKIGLLRTPVPQPRKRNKKTMNRIFSYRILLEPEIERISPASHIWSGALAKYCQNWHYTVPWNVHTVCSVWYDFFYRISYWKKINTHKLSRNTKPSKGKLYTVYTQNTNTYNKLTTKKITYTFSKHTHTHPFNGLCPGLPGETAPER